MGDEQISVRPHWRERYPWLILLHTFALAISLPVLLCGTAGVLLTPAGWRASELLFIGDVAERPYLSAAGPQFDAVMRNNARWPFEPIGAMAPDVAPLPEPLRWTMRAAPGNAGTVYWRFVEPFRMLFHPGLRVREFAYLVFGCLWTVAVWAFFGAVITRIAVVRLGREEPLNFKTALGHAVRRWPSHFAAPWMPLLGILLVCLLFVPLGWLMRLDVGAVVVGVLWIFLLIGGFFMVLLAIGVLFGWPLMWGAIASEESGDAFEAFSRSFSYTFQRPLHYLFYALVAFAFSALCWLVVYHASEGVIYLSSLGLAWGSGLERFFEVQSAERGVLGAAETLFKGGAAVVRSIAVGIAFGLFWCLAAGIYLLLRGDVDHTELDDVHLEDDHLEQPMPELARDAAGIPAVPQASTADPAQPHNPGPPSEPLSADEAPPEQDK